MLHKGDAVKSSETKGDWTEIEAPTSAYAFVAAHLLARKGSEPRRQNRDSGGRACGYDSRTHSASCCARQELPHQHRRRLIRRRLQPSRPVHAGHSRRRIHRPAVDEPPAKRIVQREGIVGGTVSIQAPTHFELESLDDGKPMDYLYTTSTNLAFQALQRPDRASSRAKKALDERWPNTPVITIQKIQVVRVMPPANLIDGRAIASQIQGETARRVAALKARGVQPGLAFVRVGEDPASRVYVGMKEKACAQLGILFRNARPAGSHHGRRIARAAGAAERRCAHARNSGAGAFAAAYPRNRGYSTGLAAKGRGRFSPGQRRQIDAGRPHWISALHTRRRAGIAGAFAGEDRRRGSGDSGARQYRGQTDGGDALPERRNTRMPP